MGLGLLFLGLSLTATPRAAVITSVVETGGDNEATDTITAKWTGVTWQCTQAGEPVPGLTVGANVTVPPFGNNAPAYVDRNHRYWPADPAVPIPQYLVGGDYIMSGNDNRDNPDYQLDVTVSEDALVYMLIDNRLADGDNLTPPEYGYELEYWVNMTWLYSEGFQPVLNGFNRNNDPYVPDEVGFDEATDNDLDQWFSVYVKQVPPGTFSLYAPNNSGRNMYGVVVTRLPNPVNDPPVISQLTPANNTLFYDPAGGLSFTATTVSPNRIEPADIVVKLNGQDVSSALALGGTATARTVKYNSLVPNRTYMAEISVSDQADRTTTITIAFDTFNAATAAIIEAEDYNHGSGSYVDPYSPNAYAGLTGTPGIDYYDHTAVVLADQYRITDSVDIDPSTDVARETFTSVGATDYQVADLQAGEWINYTRPFAAGAYNVYLRGTTTTRQAVRLDRVLSGASTTTQVLQPLGTFTLAPSTVTPQAYAPLVDAAGNAIVLQLTGPATLRLTASSARYDLALNFLILVPASGATQPAYAATVSPPPGAAGVAPDAVIGATIINGTTQVVPGSVALTLDGAAATPVTVTPTASGATVEFDPPGMLAPRAIHTVTLTFNNSDAAAQSYSWTFTVASALPTVPAAFGTAPGTGTGNGFNLKIRKAPNANFAGTAFTLANTVARADQHLADLIIDPDYELPYANEAAGPNGDGLASALVLNYEQAGNPEGYFPADEPFPYIDLFLSLDPNNIAMEATAYLELTAGIHYFGVRSDDGFQVLCRPVFDNAANTVRLGVLDGGRGEDLPGGETIFAFEILEAGLYPIRLTWWEGDGGASLEFYSLDPVTQRRTLINDRSQPGAIKSYTGRTTQIQVPWITITQPTPDQHFTTTPLNLIVKANAAVTGGTIARVEFYDTNGAKLGEDTAAPFEWPLNNLYGGRYAVSAVATDTQGLVASAGPVRFTVGIPVVMVNFQLEGVEIPEGYLADYGYVFADRGEGFSYGWDADNTAYARNRDNVISPDQRYDTFNHLQKDLPAGRIWEIELPNGRYNVYAVAGESDNINSVYDLTAEGVTFVTGTPTSAVLWFEGQAAITVQDGRLSISNGPTASNNKIAFIEIYPLPAEVLRPVIAPPTLASGQLTLTWTNGGTLQQAPAITGEWADVPGATSGTYSVPATEPRRFYRVIVR